MRPCSMLRHQASPFVYGAPPPIIACTKPHTRQTVHPAQHPLHNTSPARLIPLPPVHSYAALVPLGPNNQLHSLRDIVDTLGP